MGKFTFQDGRVYEGQWNNDVMEGRGKMTWPKKAWLQKFHDEDLDDAVFFSSGISSLPTNFEATPMPVSDHLPEGTRGEEVYATMLDVDRRDEGFSCEYEGEWKNGKKHGHGISKVFDNGHLTTYEGQWNQDYLDGAGTIRDTFDSDPNEYMTFQGHFKEGKRDGHGTEIAVSGGITEQESIGTWNGLKFMHGKIRQVRGYEKIKPGMKAELVNITVTHPGGDVFDCVATMPDKSVYTYKARNGPFSPENLFSHKFFDTKITYPSGLIYVGPWDRNAKRHGKGTLKRVGAKDLDVEFHHGKLLTKALPFAISLDECNGETECPITHDNFKEGRIVKFRNRCYSVDALASMHQNKISRDVFTREEFERKDLQLLEVADTWVKSNPPARTNTLRKTRRKVKSL
jgi:hypothetical protein